MSILRPHHNFALKMLSIVIPVYNEARTLHLILERVESVSLIGGLQKEIILVNDASTDDSEQVIKSYIASHPSLAVRYIANDRNRGKGFSLRQGIRTAKGRFLIIQDADLEYDPCEYNFLLQPVLEGHADVVYGSRFLGGRPHRILFFWHTIGNKFLTFLSNVGTNFNLTDMETCYKLFRSEIIQSIDLRENRFGFEPEVTAKIARLKNLRLYEVGISYHGRTYQEGKKINWKDGIRAIYCIIKYNFF